MKLNNYMRNFIVSIQFIITLQVCFALDTKEKDKSLVLMDVTPLQDCLTYVNGVLLAFGRGINSYDCCTFPEVTCVGDFIVKIDYSNSELYGMIDPSIGQLTHLEYFDVSNNTMLETIPQEIGNLVNLKYLNLGYNSIGGTLPKEIENLTNLETLLLNNNELYGKIPDGIGYFANLKQLSLGNNLFSGTIPPVFGSLGNLSSLDISNTNIEGSIPTELGRLTKLSNLYLNSNNLSGSIPAELLKFPIIENIYLNNNRLEGIIPIEIGDLKLLKVLNLSNNNLSGALPTTLENNNQLSELNLENNFKLTGALPKVNSVFNCNYQNTDLCFLNGLGCTSSTSQCTQDQIKKTEELRIAQYNLKSNDNKKDEKDEKSDDSGLPLYVYILIISGVVIILLILIMFLYTRFQVSKLKKNIKEKDREVTNSEIIEQNNINNSSSDSVEISVSPQSINFSDISNIANNNNNQSIYMNQYSVTVDNQISNAQAGITSITDESRQNINNTENNEINITTNDRLRNKLLMEELNSPVINGEIPNNNIINSGLNNGNSLQNNNIPSPPPYEEINSKEISDISNTN